jgi:hypothetical protein
MTLAAGSRLTSIDPHRLFAERALSAAATVRLPNKILGDREYPDEVSASETTSRKPPTPSFCRKAGGRLGDSLGILIFRRENKPKKKFFLR